MATYDFSIKSVLGYLEYNGRGGVLGRLLGREGQIWDFFKMSLH